jgi:glycosyltransferase involved in cell wall biosynthesis
LKILATLTAYLPFMAGVQIHAHNIFCRLQDRGHAVRVLTQWDRNRTDWLLGSTLFSPRGEKEYEIEGVPIRRFAFGWGDRIRMAPFVLSFYGAQGLSIPAIARAYLRKFRTEGHDWDIVFNSRVGRENIAWASHRYARELGKPFVFTPYHHPRWVGYPYTHYCELYRRADHLIAMTETEKATLVSLGARPEVISVTGTGPVVSDRTDPAGFRAKLGIPSDVPIVLFLGQKLRYKGYRELHAAIPEVLRRFPETRFVFAGPSSPDSRAFFARVAHPQVHEVDYLDLESKSSALKACDILCLPSSQESFGGVYTEAWSFGKPVVGCAIPAVAEVVTDGVDGLLGDQRPDAIAERLLHYLGHPEVARRHGEAGARKAREKYSWDILTEKTILALRKAAAR